MGIHVSETQTSGIIFDIKRYAIHDGPGIRTTVFLKGCPLRCPWCHNPESYRIDPEPAVRMSRCRVCRQCMDVCPIGAVRLREGKVVTDAARCTCCGRCADVCAADARRIIGRKVGVGEVVAEVGRDIIFFDESGGGVTFSGGEPLMQAAFLAECLRAFRRGGIHTAVDTTLYAEWEKIAEIVESADLFLCDLKHLDSEVHRRFTGVGNEQILENLRRLAGVAREIVIRIPVIPGFNEDEENIMAAGEFVRSLGSVRRVDLLPYNRHGIDKAGRLSWVYDMYDGRLAPERVDEICEALRGLGMDVRVGG